MAPNITAFDGRVAVITGAGGGLGRGYALELARRGASIVVNDLGGSTDGTGGGSSMADAVVGEITAAGGEAVACYDSVSTPEGGEAIVQAAVDNFGKVDIVINNAGILRDKSFVNLPIEDLEAVLRVHLYGAFHVTQPAFRLMKAAGYGRLLFTTSAAGLFGNFGQTNYSAAKMGLVGLSNTLAVEGQRSNILSNVVAPIARTRLTEELLGPIADRLSPEHVTPLACYLVSEECKLTHEVFSVGGGNYARAFVGLTDGWNAGVNGAESVEAIGEHIDEIRSMDNFIVPDSAIDELQLINARVSGGGSDVG
jgi:NAD(P)-dependent dehydrogenase (short-subunit alcohol dehydrogenase family)